MLNSCKALPWRWLVCCCALWSPRIAKSSLASRVERVDLKNTTKSSKSSTHFAQSIPQPWYCRFKESREKSSNQSTRTLLLPYWRWLGFGGFLGLGVLVNLKEIRLWDHGTIPCSRQFKVDGSQKLMFCLPGTEFIILRNVRDLFSLPENSCSLLYGQNWYFPTIESQFAVGRRCPRLGCLVTSHLKYQQKSNTYDIFVVHILYRNKRRFWKQQSQIPLLWPRLTDSIQFLFSSSMLLPCKVS